VTVTIRASDSGTPAQSADQSFPLTIGASFAGWQAANFKLPAETDIAAPGADPDQDGIPNLVEYALRTDPHKANRLAPVASSIGEDGRMNLTFSIRDDDPTLKAVWEVSHTLPLADAQIVEGTPDSEAADQGFTNLTFIDPAVVSDTPARFGRLRIQQTP
jgi:hypothetical protein